MSIEISHRSHETNWCFLWRFPLFITQQVLVPGRTNKISMSKAVNTREIQRGSKEMSRCELKWGLWDKLGSPNDSTQLPKLCKDAITWRNLIRTQMCLCEQKWGFWDQLGTPNDSTPLSNVRKVLSVEGPNKDSDVYKCEIKMRVKINW